jgi:hypothetical protein
MAEKEGMPISHQCLLLLAALRCADCVPRNHDKLEPVWVAPVFQQTQHILPYEFCTIDKPLVKGLDKS